MQFMRGRVCIGNNLGENRNHSRHVILRSSWINRKNRFLFLLRFIGPLPMPWIHDYCLFDYINKITWKELLPRVYLYLWMWTQPMCGKNIFVSVPFFYYLWIGKIYTFFWSLISSLILIPCVAIYFLTFWNTFYS